MKETDHHSNIVKGEGYICACLGCKNLGTSILKVKYINKTGYFCQLCNDDLLKLDLVERIGSIDDLPGEVL